jgi:hypothetical protein
MGWADEVEKEVAHALDNSFDPSLEDVGMDLNAEAQAQAEGGGGNPMANRFGGRPTAARTTDYNNPISQRFSNNYVDIIGSDTGLQAVVDAVKAGVQEVLGTSVTDEDLMNQAIAKQNQFGHPVFTSWNKTSESIPAVDTFAGIQQAANATRIRDSEAAMRANIDPVVASLKAKVGNFIQSLKPEESWQDKSAVGKILDTLGSGIYSTVSGDYTKVGGPDWSKQAPWNLDDMAVDAWGNIKSNVSDFVYGTPFNETVTGGFPNQATVKQAIDAQAWVDKNFPSDEQTTSQTVAAGTGDWSQDFQTPTQNLGSTLDMVGSQGLLTGAALAEETLGAPGSWYGQTPIDANEFVMGAGPYGTMATEEDDTGFTPVQEDLGMGLTVKTDLNQAMQDATDITSGVDSFSGMPVGSSPVTGLNKEDYMAFVDSLNAQPIGSSPLAPAYNEAYNYSGADFPGNAGINAVGTAFGPTWEQEFPTIDSEDWVGDTDEFGLTLSKKGMDPKGKQLPWVDARTVTGDAQRDLARQWEKTVNDEWSVLEDDLFEKKEVEDEKVKKDAKKFDYGPWKGKLNIDKNLSKEAKIAKQQQNVKDYLQHKQAFMDHFISIFGNPDDFTRSIVNGEKISHALNKEKNRVKSTDEFLVAYNAVNPNSLGNKLGGFSMVGKLAGGIQNSITKKGLGNTTTLDQVRQKVADGEYGGDAEVPPPHPRDKVSGGFWGLINFAKKNPKIFGSLSGDELWALVSEPEDFWSYYETGLAGD